MYSLSHLRQSSSLKQLAVGFVLAIVLCSCGGPLPRGDWNKDVRKELNKLIRSEGLSSKGYDPAYPPYAVFDFDNTTIINDIELCTAAYQIGFLRFKILPEEMMALLLSAIPDPDASLIGISDHEVSAGMLARDITQDYAWLYANYISLWPDPEEEEAQKAFRKIDGRKEYLDFRAKLSALGNGVQSTFGYAEACFWTENLFKGMTEEDIVSLVHEAAVYNLSKKKITSVTWESPKRGEAGKISVSFPEGMALTDEMRGLYDALRSAGFDVYIFSASRECIVEAVACDSTFGLCLSPEQVYGLRLLWPEEGHAVFDTSYVQPYTQGKADAINAYIAPLHGGKGPALVAGDSGGDFAMLTSFPDLRLGLIVNCLRSGNISRLTRYALDGTMPEDFQPYPNVKYVVQGRDINKKKFLRRPDSVGLL